MTGFRYLFLLSLIVTAAGLQHAAAQPATFFATFERAFPQVKFERPVALRADPVSGYLFVVEQAGVIRTFAPSDGATHSHTVLDIRSRVLGQTVDPESGLLSVALHPAFSENGYIYVFYISDAPSTRISRFETAGTPAIADPESEQVLIEFGRDQIKHNGGDLHFGPDGFLYASIGDGGCCGDPYGHGQDLSTLLGTIIRIDVDADDGGLYGIPPDNPFADDDEGRLPEIWAYGLRNPWRFSFHPETGEIWVGDVGELTFEEINRVLPGGNYGWPVMEGPECLIWPPGSGIGEDCDPVGTLPAYSYGRSQGVSVTGGLIYRGSRRPSVRGRYIFADWGMPRIMIGTPSADHSTLENVVTVFRGSDPFISAFGEDASGEMHFLGYFTGHIYRFRRGSDSEEITAHLHLDGPNPTTSTTQISIDLLDFSIVRVDVVDVLGRRVRTVVEESLVPPGSESFTVDLSGLASGTYFVVLTADGAIAQTRRVTLVR
jgi:glucose/arabinose dehydrogenase